MQRFDPVGVAARTPAECLLTQIEVYGYDDPILIELVRDHLEDLEKKRYKPLAKKFHMTHQADILLHVFGVAFFLSFFRRSAFS